MYMKDNLEQIPEDTLTDIEKADFENFKRSELLKIVQSIRATNNRGEADSNLLISLYKFYCNASIKTLENKPSSPLIKAEIAFLENHINTANIQQILSFNEESLALEKKNIQDIPSYLSEMESATKEVIANNIKYAKENNPFSNQGIFKISDYEKKFNLTGAVNVPQQDFVDRLKTDSDLKGFFLEEGRTDIKGNKAESPITLSGYNRFIALDANLEVPELLKILKKEIFDSFALLKKLEKNNIELTDDNRLFYLEVIGSLKTASLALFNALIIKEKQGDFKNFDQSYQRHRLWLEEFTEHAVKQYYRILTGSKLKVLDDDSMLNELSLVDEIMTYLNINSKKGDFSSPELTNPLSIVGSVANIIKDNSDIDTVVSVPSGGTEVAIALSLGYELLEEKDVDILILPVSLHSSKKNGNGERANIRGESLKEYLKNRKKRLGGKKIKVVDDNSSTGSTMEEVRQILLESGVESVSSSVVMADLRRTLLNANREDKPYIASPDLYTNSVAPLSVSNHLRPRGDLKEIQEKLVLVRHYQKLKTSTEVDAIVKKLKVENLVTNFTEEFTNSENILKFQKTPFSNFALVPIDYEGSTYPSVEHAYMAAKFKTMEPISKEIAKLKIPEIIYKFINHKLEMRDNEERVSSENIDSVFENSKFSAGDIKEIVKILHDYIGIRDDFNTVKLPLMIKFLIQKFNQQPYQKLLEETNNKMLVEGNSWGDTYWGVDNKTGKGNNFLGRALMAIRDSKK